MLIGEYTHTLDHKKRVSLPTKFRRQLGKELVITHGLDNCLFLYSRKEWEKITTKLSDLPLGPADTRRFARFLLAGAEEVSVDQTGRILIPDFLKTFANLKSKVVLAGLHSRVEIWNEASWRTYQQQTEKNADTLAEKLGDIGFI